MRLPLLSFAPLLALLLLLPSPARAGVTLFTDDGVYTTIPTPVTPTAGAAAYTGLPAYDPTELSPPAPPSPAITAGSISLPGAAAGIVTAGIPLSINQKGNFLGFSIEMSVANDILGNTGATVKPIFLNYMANIKNRAGSGPIIRVGGNTQEDSTIYAKGFPGGYDPDSIVKLTLSDSPTHTPVVTYTDQLLYTMANITSLVNADWYFGLAFNQTMVEAGNQGNIAEAVGQAQKILGNNLRGLALGNEPDLYVDHGARPYGYDLQEYFDEWSNVSAAVIADTGINQLTGTNMGPFVGPSICCQVPGFDVPDVINAGYLTNFSALGAFTVQHYPENNCAIDGNVVSPQEVFPNFLNHSSAVIETDFYSGAAQQVIASGREMIMLEFNTASCAGFPGISDSFGAAMWITDWALQLAQANFTAALMHVGGQHAYYNPFTPPPGNLSSIYQWTTGSVYYASLVVAELFGQSNVSQIADVSNLNLVTGENDTSSIFHPAYAVYENGAPSRLALFNFVSDTSGASTYQATISLSGGGSLPSSVSVRYLQAATVAVQGNITWAGQTMGGTFGSDGRLYGNVQTETVQCTNGQCVIPVPAPAIAVVYLSDQALADSSVPTDAVQAYSTTVLGEGSATYDPKALQTSNGQNGPAGELGSNSQGGIRNSGARRAGPAGAAGTVGAGAGLLGAVLAWAAM